MKLLRNLLGRLSRNWVIRRRLPPQFDHRPIYVSPRAGLAYLKPLTHTHAELFAFAAGQVKPGDTVWDLGASMGVFAVAASAMAGPKGRVLCVEPDPFSAALLRRSAAANAVLGAQIDVVQAACADRMALEEFRSMTASSALGHLAAAGGSGFDPHVASRSHVITVTMDWLAEQHGAPAVIKADLEGAELMALRGGAETLRRHRPRLLLEVYERNADAVTTLLKGLGYRLHDFSDPTGPLREVERAAYNTLALPTPG